MTLPTDPIELEAAARERMSPAAYAFFAFGAVAEQSLEDNVAAWRAWHLRPRMLRGTADLDVSTSVLGTEVSFPVLLAPCGIMRLAHEDGELAAARAAAESGTLQVVSTTSSIPVEKIAEATTAPKWFQLYCDATPEGTDARIRRAIDCDFRTIAITVDTPYLGLRYKGLADLSAFSEEISAFDMQAGFVQTPNLVWSEIERIVSTHDVPVLLKGILHPDDARRAVEAGVDGIIVSNHGARQLDGTIPPALALPEIVEASGDLEVYVDGGVRNGVDVLRALALGARAVLIGRPYLWALAIGGEAGVVELLERLRTELHNAMALSGQPSAKAVDRDIVVAAP